MKSIILILAIMIQINLYCAYDFSKLKLVTNSKDFKELKSLFDDKCEEVSGSDVAYKNLQKGTEGLYTCVMDLFNSIDVQPEMAVAEPIGDHESEFNKYCKKRSDLMSCLTTFNGIFGACLDEEEKNFSNIFLHIIQSILDFVCYKGGENIVLFIAGNGVECIEKNSETIENCFSTFADDIPKTIASPLNETSELSFGTKQCLEIKNLGSCILKGLEKCDEKTPATIIESMFQLIKNETKCY